MANLSTLHIVHSLDNNQGGTPHAALNVVKFLLADGFPAEVVTSRGPKDDLDYLREDFSEVRTHFLPRKFPACYYNAPDLSSWLVREGSRFDAVELHGIWNGVIARASLYCRRAGKPYLVRSHGSLDPFDLQKHALLKRMLGPWYVRPLVNGAAGVVCTTELEAKLLVTYGGHAQRFVVPLPVPHGPAVDAGAGLDFRRRYRIPEKALAVLFLSRIDVKKGLQFLVPALAQLKLEIPDLWLILAGSGERAFVNQVKDWLRQHRVDAWTTLPGFLSGADKQAALQAADLFVLPSLNENFGLVVVEAMRAGLGLIISDQVYLHSMISKARAGVVCEPSATACEKALRQVLSDEALRRSMGANARQLVNRYFSPEAATRRLIEVYRTFLKPRADDPLVTAE